MIIRFCARYTQNRVQKYIKKTKYTTFCQKNGQIYSFCNIRFAKINTGGSEKQKMSP